MAEHLQVDRYGAFWLTDAIRPSLDRQIIPRQAYRIETYRDAYARDQDIDAVLDAARLLGLLEAVRPEGLSWRKAERKRFDSRFPSRAPSRGGVGQVRFRHRLP